MSNNKNKFNSQRTIPEKIATSLGGLFIAGLVTLGAAGVVEGVKSAVKNSEAAEDATYKREKEVLQLTFTKGTELELGLESRNIAILRLSSDQAKTLRNMGSIYCPNADYCSFYKQELPTDLTKTSSTSEYSLAPLGPGGIPVPILSDYKPSHDGIDYQVTDYSSLNKGTPLVTVASTEPLGDTSFTLHQDKQGDYTAYWVHIESSENNLSTNPILLIGVDQNS